MRLNTKKLLVWLYPAHDEQRLVPLAEVNQLLSNLTPGGRRSLLFHLEESGLIAREEVASQVSIRLTQQGQRAVTTEFPAFHPDRLEWRGQWSIITFLEAPSNDLQFRYLRTQLLKHQASQLTRGLYLYPGQLPVELTQLLQNLYPIHTVVWQSKSWLFGDERAIISKQFLLSDVVSAYSGISSELNELLAKDNAEKASIYTSKVSLFLVFDRFVAILANDLNLHYYYFPQVPSALTLLQEFQHLLSP